MILEATDLAFRWPARTIGPLSLALGPGVWQVAGANGSGKTTLLRLLCGSLRPASGEVRVLGRDVHADPLARRDVALVPVRPDLPDFLAVDEAWQMLASLRGRPHWDGSPLRGQLSIPGAARLSTLSAGQRRRAEILAGLAGDPAVLLLDEPFADLDVDGVAWLADWIGSVRSERVILFAHHGACPVEVDGVVGGG
jgi:ABC-2 type transport system ATP-binding protein